MTNEFCKGGGCTAKLGPGILDKVLKMIPKKADPNLLVGFDHSDDAAVYQLTDDLAVVQTLDFFPPMVEDPYLFGKIAAANALSDIYAMGGEVKTALNIVCFPESMDANVLGQILLGGNEKVTEAGGVLAGGHSINDTDVKYGLSVMGTIHPKKILENNHCMEGDCLILTKPLGVGIVMTASRMKAASKEAFDQAVDGSSVPAFSLRPTRTSGSAMSVGSSSKTSCFTSAWRTTSGRLPWSWFRRTAIPTVRTHGSPASSGRSTSGIWSA